MPRKSSERPRVLFITSPRAIGADTWVHLLLLRHLSQERFDLHAAGQLADSDEPARALEALRDIPGIAIKPTHFGPSLYQQSTLKKLESALGALPAAASLLGLANYIRSHRIQILHATDRPRDALACVALAALTGAKAVIHVHVEYGDWMSRGVKWAMGRADALVGISAFVAESLRLAGYRSERVHAVLNGIDLARWDPELSPLPGRESLKVSAHVPLIVSIARIFGAKGHAELIRALALVKAELGDVRLAIVGSDYPEGSGATRELTKLAAELGLAENVIFTGQRQDIPSLLAASDVFALPSHREPFGLVYAEAMAMKRPVVALTNGGTPEVVTHGETGLLARPGDIHELAAHLLKLLRDPALRASLGANGRRAVEARFTAPRLADDFAALYARMLG